MGFQFAQKLLSGITRDYTGLSGIENQLRAAYWSSARIGLRTISSCENALRPGCLTSQLSIQGSD